MSDIQQLLCTHCTFGTSALENEKSGEAAGKVLGYSVRASSIEDRATLREAFRAVERLLAYDLPADASAENRKQLDAATAPVRLFFIPEISGRQVVGQLAFRPFDTAGRPGSYFAHMLVGSTSPPWSVLECLRLWGRKDEEAASGWCSADREAGFDGLRSLSSLDAWHGPQRAEHWDELSRRFLKQGSAPSAFRNHLVMPERWRSSTTEAERTAIVMSVMQALLDIKSLRKVVLAIEPAVAAIIFHTALRLMPPMMRSRVGFSTYEPDPDRASYRLVATTFITSAGDLKPQLYQSEAYVCNSFKGFLTGSYRPIPGTYVRWAVRMLVEGKTSHIDSLFSAIKKVWSPAPDSLSAADLERIMQLEDYRTRLFRGDIHPPAADLTKAQRHFLAKRCSSAVRAQQAHLREMPASESARLVRTLMDVIKPFPEEWKAIESAAEIAALIKGAMPTDERSVLGLLSRPASFFSDADAVELLCGYVKEHGSLPGVTDQSRRLWGAIASEHPQGDYAPPALLTTLLGQLEPGSLKRILPPTHAGVIVVQGVARAIVKRLQALPDHGPGSVESRSLASHLRCVLDDAARDLGGPDFELLLRGSQDLCGFYNPDKGDFGDRVSRFVHELRARAAQVCVDAEIFKLASTWAQCASNPTALYAQLTAWRKLLSWLAIFDRSRGSKIPFAGTWSPVNRGVFGEIQAILKEIVPDGEAAAPTMRRNLLTTIISTYRQKGWLPGPGKSLLGFGTATDYLQDMVEEICKPQLR